MNSQLRAAGAAVFQPVRGGKAPRTGWNTAGPAARSWLFTPSAAAAWPCSARIQPGRSRATGHARARPPRARSERMASSRRRSSAAKPCPPDLSACGRRDRCRSPSVTHLRLDLREGGRVGAAQVGERLIRGIVRTVALENLDGVRGVGQSGEDREEQAAGSPPATGSEGLAGAGITATALTSTTAALSTGPGGDQRHGREVPAEVSPVRGADLRTQSQVVVEAPVV